MVSVLRCEVFERFEECRTKTVFESFSDKIVLNLQLLCFKDYYY